MVDDGHVKVERRIIVPCEIMNATQYSQLRRKRNALAGLTVTGKDRVNKSHPELSGLSGAEYHLAYMRKQRKSDREAWGKPIQ